MIITTPRKRINPLEGLYKKFHTASWGLFNVSLIVKTFVDLTISMSIPKILPKLIFTLSLNLLLTEDVYTKTIIIPPKNIIIRVYINQIKPIRCIINPNRATKLTSLRHIENGDLTIKSVINLTNSSLFINII